MPVSTSNTSTALRKKLALISMPDERLRLPRSGEHAVALHVDDLLCLGDRELHRLVPAVMGISPDELVLLHAIGCLLLDHAGGLIEAIGRVRGGTNAVALVLDRRSGRLAVVRPGACAQAA